jgi:putative transposase
VKAVKERDICIRVACQAFSMSESCYSYERKLDAENEEVATRLIKLTDNNRNWGFGLCYLYLRNLKGCKWNQKRVYRVYKELELTLRIKPRKRLVREKPEALKVPFRTGLQNGESGLNTFNQQIHSKMLMLKDSTVQFATNGCNNITPA